jgi:multidrug efflux pump subunit AcrB
MKRTVSFTANVAGEDLGRVAGRIDGVLNAVNQSLWKAEQSPEGKQAWKNIITGDVLQQTARPSGEPPGMTVEVRGQVKPMRQMFGGLAGGPIFEGLTGGLILAVVVILLLLAAYFQSVRLALVVVSTAPAVIAGVALALVVTRTTLNLQSFMGAVMAVGVAVANAILLAIFAEQARREKRPADEAVVDGAQHRLRPILMTSCAMIAGMIPMALGFSEGGEQTAPLGRAVIGGLAVATLATLFVLPSVFTVVQGRSSVSSASLDPDDPESANFDKKNETADGEPNRDGASQPAHIAGAQN